MTSEFIKKGRGGRKVSITGPKVMRAYRIPEVLLDALARASDRYGVSITSMVIDAIADKICEMELQNKSHVDMIPAKLDEVAGILRGEGVRR